MNLHDKDAVRVLAERLACTDIDSLELAGPDLTLRLVRVSGGEVEAEFVPTEFVDSDSAADASIETLRAGSVGVLLIAHPMREEPLVQPGDSVAAGQALLLLQVGQVLLPVTAPCAGRVRRVLAAAGSRVGYGSALLEFEPLPEPA